MIDIVSGTVASQGKDHLVVMVGGIGLHIAVTRTVLERLDGASVTLYTHLIVREDALSLYGFADEEERLLFQTLLTVSGVGPRIALTILSTITREQLQHAVVHEEADVLTRVPGIGKKTAQKIVFELKDKIATSLSDRPVVISDVDADVLAALTTLGYSIVEAQSALQSIPRDAPNEIEERVRLALQYFT
ncbi:MAG: Holliday junction branch migration protein RuvA [Anaerolineae bacterium]|nr:Holliday junction branch migration protein RuvA [Anaerolineae bacterium]